MEKGCDVVSCHMEKFPWQGTGGAGDLWPTAKEEVRSSAQPPRRN